MTDALRTLDHLRDEIDKLKEQIGKVLDANADADFKVTFSIEIDGIPVFYNRGRDNEFPNAVLDASLDGDEVRIMEWDLWATPEAGKIYWGKMISLEEAEALKNQLEQCLAEAKESGAAASAVPEGQDSGRSAREGALDRLGDIVDDVLAKTGLLEDDLVAAIAGKQADGRPMTADEEHEFYSRQENLRPQGQARRRTSQPSEDHDSSAAE